jgi:hypothetical protein
MRQLVVSSPDDSRAIISFEKQIRFDYRPVKRAEIPSTPKVTGNGQSRIYMYNTYPRNNVDVFY